MSARQAATAESYEAQLARVVLDPVQFVRGILDHNPWTVSEQILRSVADCPRTAVKACHSSSKTFTAAEATLWWVTRWSDGIVITTAPTWTQVERVLWGEIHKAVGRSRVSYPPLTQTELKVREGNYAMGLSTDQGVRFQGFKGRVLVIIDEAPGVSPEIWEAIESIRAGGYVHILAIGNPTEIGGPFYDAFTSNRDGWSTFTISAFNTPNLAGLSLERLLTLEESELDHNIRPYLISRRWVREKHAEWGANDPRWQSRVLGEFPKSGTKEAIPLALVEQCIDIEIEGWKRKPLHFGCDVAAFGDDRTVILGTKGGRIVFLEIHTKQSTMETVGQIVNILKEIPVIDGFRIDEGGVVGVTHRLLELGCDITPINFGWSAYHKDEYANLRAELWWLMRRMFEEKQVSIPRNAALIADLTAPRYKFRSDGRILLESKEDMKKRGMKSPDIADALALSLYPENLISKARVM